MSDSLKMLPVKLDALEAQQRAKELADTLLAIERTEEAETERRRAAKDALETKASELAGVVRSGTERRPTMVTQHDNTVRWTIDMIRMDTGEVYESRAMTATEREKASQLALWANEEVERSESAEPGRKDTLPEAARPSSPKRREPRTKADALVADASGVSGLYEQPSGPA